MLDADDAKQINRRRTTGDSIKLRMERFPATWPEGAQAHIGRPVNAGDIFPAIIVNTWGSTNISLQVFLRGSDTYWLDFAMHGYEHGTWHWPPRVVEPRIRTILQAPVYQCHKRVRALKIDSIRWNSEPIVLGFRGYLPVDVSREWCAARKVEVGGYYVVYEDGYTSFSPAEAFEKGYTCVTEGIANQLVTE